MNDIGVSVREARQSCRFSEKGGQGKPPKAQQQKGGKERVLGKKEGNFKKKKGNEALLTALIVKRCKRSFCRL